MPKMRKDFEVYLILTGERDLIPNKEWAHFGNCEPQFKRPWQEVRRWPLLPGDKISLDAPYGAYAFLKVIGREFFEGDGPLVIYVDVRVDRDYPTYRQNHALLTKAVADELLLHGWTRE